MRAFRGYGGAEREKQQREIQEAPVSRWDQPRLVWETERRAAWLEEPSRGSQSSLTEKWGKSVYGRWGSRGRHGVSRQSPLTPVS